MELRLVHRDWRVERRMVHAMEPTYGEKADQCVDAMSDALDRMCTPFGAGVDATRRDRLRDRSRNANGDGAAVEQLVLLFMICCCFSLSCHRLVLVFVGAVVVLSSSVAAS